MSDFSYFLLCIDHSGGFFFAEMILLFLLSFDDAVIII